MGVVTEFQTEPEPEILDRALEYTVRLRRGLRFGPPPRTKYQVVAALVSLTGPASPPPWEWPSPGSDVPSTTSPPRCEPSATKTPPPPSTRSPPERSHAGSSAGFR